MANTPMIDASPMSLADPEPELVSLALIRLMYLVSPALPIGAYAYSQALEWAVESGAVTTPASTQSWLQGVMQYGLAQLELPILHRLLLACAQGDVSAIEKWNDFILASRESHELWLEDTQLGTALRRLLMKLGHPIPVPLQEPAQVSLVALFAVACEVCEIPANQALAGLLWSWLENQVACATKLIPLGQSQAQALLWALGEHIPALVSRALTVAEPHIGNSLPGLVMASMKHETQYTRLFRS